MGILSNPFVEINEDKLQKCGFSSAYLGKPQITIVNPNLSHTLKCNRIVEYKDSQKLWVLYTSDKHGYGFSGAIYYFPIGFDKCYAPKEDDLSDKDIAGKVYLKIDNDRTRFTNPKWRDLLPVNDIGELDAAIEYVNKTIQMYCDNYEKEMHEALQKRMEEYRNWQTTQLRESMSIINEINEISSYK